MNDRERWNNRYRDQAERLDSSSGAGAEADRRFDPPAVLRRLANHLPSSGVAIDVAGGTGGGALHYAAVGLEAVLVDVSDEALSQAEAHATANGIRLHTLCLDLQTLELGGLLTAVRGTYPELGAVTVVSCFHYLQRNLLTSIANDLPAGATFLAAIATKTNLERNEHPSQRFLLDPGELEQLVVGSKSQQHRLTIRHTYEGWNDGDHHEAELVVEAESGLR